jgi:hypothetical protein
LGGAAGSQIPLRLFFDAFRGVNPYDPGYLPRDERAPVDVASSSQRSTRGSSASIVGRGPARRKTPPVEPQ